MNVKRFVAENMQQALRMVSAELGPDAVIVSSKKLERGMEVVASVDMAGAAQASQPGELERQLRLQRELDAAREATRESEQKRKSDREELVRRSDLSGADGIREALSALRSESPASPSRKPQEPNTTAQPAAAQNGEYQTRLQEMQGELRELKDWLVSHQGSAWDTRRPLTWQQSQLWQRCQDMGLEPAWADRIASASPGEGELDAAWKQAMEMIRGDLPITAPGLLERGGRIALVGPTGAGKTTTIGKIAARFVLRHGPESVAFITLDNYRVAAHDQLRTFSRILGVDLKVVKQGDDLAKAIESVRDKKLVLIDSAGLASQDPHFSVQLSMLKQAGAGITKLLVLPLTSQARCLQENYEHFKGAGLNGCVFTKMDECFSLGAGMSVAALTRLPVTLVTDGPHIPDDLHYPDAARLVNLAEQMARMARTRWQAAEAMSMANQQQSFQHGV
ncbi:flagellar biosynthesis protein FlhF [Thalassolituus sp.]|jgi:flagellar biosynthesis protein FlhF|uniref:flagellar biosynthesis protein FlhF n=1 Tax=Thalassolituus sp. TaxID=2030822 RepID=UPI00262A433B|nr:flagellar biosynthesis protein FlhF [uncultured Thalassolituus sp.]